MTLACFLGAGAAHGQGLPRGSIHVVPLPAGDGWQGRPANANTNPRDTEIGARLRGKLQGLSARDGAGSILMQLAPAQRRPFVALKGLAGEDLEVRLRRHAGTPLEIKGSRLEPAILDLATGRPRDEETARAFLRRHGPLLRLEDPDGELALAGSDRDDLGGHRLRFAQAYRGLRVWPAEVSVELDGAGNVVRLSGAFVPTPRIRTSPVLDGAAASRAAREAVPGGASARAGEPELMIYAPGHGPPRLAWSLEVYVSLPRQWLVIVDAAGGRILTAYNRVMFDGNVAGSGTDLLGSTRPLNVWEEGGTHFLADTSKVMFDPASNPPSQARGAIVVVDARNQPPTADPDEIPDLFHITSATPTSGFLADGVSAAFGFSETYDYYLERHSRDSLDGTGGTILAAVRLGQSFFNAFYVNNQIFFGDAAPFAACIDVVGHELTHGVTEKTANLIYQDQPGALNEAFSDIFGEAIEAFSLGDNDWLVGTNLGPGQVLRNLADPSSIACCFGRNFPSRFSEFIFTSEDNGGVHINSCIVGHAFYLLAEGLPGAVGIPDAERIFYRALSVKLVASSRFIDARLACISSAEDLFGAGSAQAQKTAEAFDQVEILDGVATPDPAPIPGVNSTDATLFIFLDSEANELRLGRREEVLGDPSQGSILTDRTVSLDRPSVSGNGSFCAFVDALDDACIAATNNSDAIDCLGFPGRIASVAVAPSGDLFGFVLLDDQGDPLNSITVIDLSPGGGSRTFTLDAPTTQDGVLVGTVLFADVMDFTTDGRFLVYDALNRVELSDGSLIDLWSIYALDLATERILPVVSPTPGLNIGNPSLGQTDDSLIVFDAQDSETGVSTVSAASLVTGEVAAIAEVEGLGVPSFTGDDSAVVYSQVDAAVSTGSSLLRQAVGADGITPEGDPSVWLADAAAGVIYRRGDFIPPSDNLAVTKIKAPKRITLSDRKPAVIRSVSVEIQNRSPHNEVIQDLNMLRGLVGLSVTSLGDCEPIVPRLRTPRKPFPLILKPKKKLKVVFDVTFDCANDPLKTSRQDPGHDDFSYQAVVDHSVLNGEPDTDTSDDTCPHIVSPPFRVVETVPGLKDRGCGKKRDDGTFGDAVVTDVVEK